MHAISTPTAARPEKHARQRRLALAAVLAVVLVVAAALYVLTRGAAGARAERRGTGTSSSVVGVAELGDVAPARVAVEPKPPPESEPPAQAPTQPVATHVKQPGLVIGRVVGAEDEPIAGVTIEAWQTTCIDEVERSRDGPPTAGPAASAVTDVDGGFSFQLHNGEYGFLFGEAHLRVPAPTLRVGAGDTRRVDLKLPALAALEIHVLDDAGRGAPNVRVSGWCDGRGDLKLRTDSDGRAIARHLSAGEVRVLVNDPDLGRGDLAVVLAPATMTRIEIPLRRRANW